MSNLIRVFFIVFISYFSLIPLSLAATTALKSIPIPIDEKSNWKEISFDYIPANNVLFRKNSLTINVDKSNSILIFPFEKIETIQQLKLKAKIKGQLSIPEGKEQGEQDADDFVLRIGLVELGEKKLTTMQKALAPEWVLQLFKLAPDGTGIKGIKFLNIPNNDRLTGTKRIHPTSDLIEEKFLMPANDQGEININYTYPEPQKAIALWLSVDGDDTHSQYQLHVSEIILNSY